MKWTRVLIPTGVAVLAASAIAVAAGGGDTINGCVATSGRSKGDLRVLVGSGKCSKNETAVSWNKTGPQGAAGPAGQQGPKGDTGPQGPAGSAAPADAMLFGGRALSDPSVTAYLKVVGIDGEAKAAGYENQSELKSFKFSIDRSGNASTIGTFDVTAFADKAAPVFAKKALTGVSSVAQISFVKQTSAGPRQFMVVKLAGARIDHWSVGGEREPETLERLSFAPTKWLLSYKPVGDDGSLGGEVKVSHNVATTEVNNLSDADFPGL